MITDYKRPSTIDDALSLLRDQEIHPFILSKGSYPDESNNEMFTAIDFQLLGFNEINCIGDRLETGGSVSLQQLYDHPDCPSAIRQAMQVDAGRNVRNSYSIHSHIMTSNGRSALTTVLLAIDTTVELLPEGLSKNLVGFLEHRGDHKNGTFISKVIWSGSPVIAFESIARTPLDQPIICASTAKWSNGRLRIVLGGYGRVPTVAYDGFNMVDVDQAIQFAALNSGDEWASSEYRQEMARILTLRCLKTLETQAGEQRGME